MKSVNVNLKDDFYRIDWKVEIIALATSGALSSLYLGGNLLFQFHQFKSSNARTLQFKEDFVFRCLYGLLS